ncbi:hypothetical protein KHC33_14440 [Methanospirillum sp. J.3.6.1-F.2.7.3]|uniref:Uncharacterized protein n=1 Tax=Methanospirillum purgamenti TaxID=2834276 RepID=A0A8E7AVS8_9EURY|nr:MULTISPECIES: hypothetical protein [Methanospirillum]MDX8548808.1 hypothetical protein [Methanospirillum hungatei]QVV88507.1 hypothetical protein KHC33_14440 [Methanospirillum sp. J.3.6.1-F.2.7.3]
MNIIKVLRRQELNDGYLSVDYLLSGHVTLEGLDILSQRAYTITGHQYLSTCYQIQKPENIQITGILQSSVIQVTFPAYSAGYIEEYLSALVNLIPEEQHANSFVQTLFDDVKMILRSNLQRKNSKNLNVDTLSHIFVE